jgi:xylulokinase
MIGAEVGSDTVAIRAMGGGVKSSLWVQVLADILGRPVEVTQRSETTALGAAILAAAAMSVEGEGGVVATAKRMSRGWRTVEPELGGVGAERHRRLAEVYARLYPVLAPLFREIGEIETD